MATPASLRLVATTHVAYGLWLLLEAFHEAIEIVTHYPDRWAPFLVLPFALFGLLHIAAGCGVWLLRPWGRLLSLVAGVAWLTGCAELSATVEAANGLFPVLSIFWVPGGVVLSLFHRRSAAMFTGAGDPPPRVYRTLVGVVSALYTVAAVVLCPGAAALEAAVGHRGEYEGASGRDRGRAEAALAAC